jgi:hypothetical protein
VEGEPRLHAICHCADCKRRTGSAFGESAYFLRSNVTESKGDMTRYAVHRRDDDQECYFCKTCGGTLFWYTAVRPHLVGIPGGCFPEGSLGEPTVSAKTGEKVSWITLSPACKPV